MVRLRLLHSFPKGTTLRSAALLTVPAVLAIALLTGCSTSPGANSNGTVSDSAPSSSAATPEATEAAAENPKFGQTFTFKNGLAVSISAPAAYTPSTYASGAGANNIKMTVTVNNGTDTAVSPVIFQYTATAAGQAGASIIDSEQHVGDFSTGNVAPGASTSYDIGFAFTGSADGVTVTLDPTDFVSKPATFTS